MQTASIYITCGMPNKKVENFYDYLDAVTKGNSNAVNKWRQEQKTVTNLVTCMC